MERQGQAPHLGSALTVMRRFLDVVLLHGCETHALLHPCRSSSSSAIVMHDRDDIAFVVDKEMIDLVKPRILSRRLGEVRFRPLLANRR